MTSPPTAKSGRSSTATTAMAPADPRCHTAVVHDQPINGRGSCTSLPTTAQDRSPASQDRKITGRVDVQTAYPRLQYPAHGADLLKCSAAVDKYSEPNSNASVACPTFPSTVQSGTDDFSSPALAAIALACRQIGKPYVWGGNGDPGFDCSGLAQAAYVRRPPESRSHVPPKASTTRVRPCWRERRWRPVTWCSSGPVSATCPMSGSTSGLTANRRS